MKRLPAQGHIPVALTIAGSDPSGGAGIQADLKTFHQFGVYGEAVLTLLTVQNTLGVTRVEMMPPDLIGQQIASVLADIPPNAAKTGALGCTSIVRAVAQAAAQFAFPLIVDPVMISKHGAPLMTDEAQGAVLNELAPYAFLITPNLAEAEALTGIQVRNMETMRRAAERLTRLGARNVLVKGGHLPGCAIDVLLTGDGFEEFSADRLDTPHTHGTGCTYSAAITAEVAKGAGLVAAIRQAKIFITRAIKTNPGLGRGTGPVNHHASTKS